MLLNEINQEQNQQQTELVSRIRSISSNLSSRTQRDGSIYINAKDRSFFINVPRDVFLNDQNTLYYTSQVNGQNQQGFIDINDTLEQQVNSVYLRSDPR